MTKRNELQRSLSLPVLIFYGVGTMIGAGIYALAGQVAGLSGMLAPFSFLTAAFIAFLTGYSYAQLSSRYPLSSGEAVYVNKAFRKPRFSTLIGLLVCFSGIISAGAITHGFVAYFQVFFMVPDWQVVTVVTLVMGILAMWGIRQSAFFAVVITIIEVTGLFLILWIGRSHLQMSPETLSSLVPSLNSVHDWSLVSVGAFLAFYAFIGFEDMVNVAEEVKHPERSLPIAIIWSIVITTFLYCSVTLVAVLSLSPEQLTSNGAPFALLYEQETGSSPILITGISLLAVLNGLLIQLIMVSRVLYGMSAAGWIPTVFGIVHPRTKTPVISTACVTVLVLCLTLLFPIVFLAEWTSGILLFVFASVNVACMRILLQEGRHVYSLIVPFLGCVTTLGLLFMRLLT